jgi:hypothetical protein
MKRILLVAVLIAGCDFSKGKDYYPLAVNYYWNYEVSNLNPGTGEDSRSILDTLYVRVLATTRMTSGQYQGRVVYQQEDEGLVPFWWFGDTNFIAKPSDSLVVYDSLESNDQMVLALFGSEVGGRWVGWASPTDTVYGEVVANENVTVKAGEFADCIRVEYTSSQSTDWKYTAWFASGVGPVQYEYVNGLVSGNPSTRRWGLIAYSVKAD